jgi:crotonobetainyl-CoA:carnitine CoA-transferase CaiB-like acyl-CoA transferase
VLRTPYRIGTAGAAALGALGCAVADLHVLRGGERQSVRVDRRAAAVSLRSARYLRVNGEAPPVWDPLSGFYPVRDGWISIHCNFLNHREAALRVLAASPDRESMGQRARGWDGEALEAAIHEAGGCAGFVRTAAQWQAHPQSRAVAAQPVLRITRIGDAPPEPLAAHARPLGGLRVLDLTRVLAGPTCARSLAEHGADVLKITAAHLPDSGAVELDTGIGKLSARLDLRDGQQRHVLKRLARDADVFSQSYRPGALDARGFSPEALAELAAGHRVRLALGLGHERPLGGAARLRQYRAVRERHGDRVGKRGAAGADAGLGHRLRERLPDGVRRGGSAAPARARRRQLAGAGGARARRAVDRRARHAAGGAVAQGAARARRRGARGAARRGRFAGRQDPLPRAGAPAFRDAAVLEPAAGAARHARPRMA